MRSLFSSLVLLVAFGSVAHAQDLPVHVPAPIFRVPPAQCAPQESSSWDRYAPPPHYGPVYAPPAWPAYAPRRQPYYRSRQPRDLPEELSGIFAGVVITIFLIAALVAR